MVATRVEAVAFSVDGVGHLGACGAGACRMCAGRVVWGERLRWEVIADLQLRSRIISMRDKLTLKPPARAPFDQRFSRGVIVEAAEHGRGNHCCGL